jgi:hypothetical protein
MEPPKVRQPRKPTVGKADKAEGGKEAQPRKRTLILTAENDIRLSTLASIRNKDRSELVNQILKDALKNVRGHVLGEGETAAPESGAGQGEKPAGLFP